MLARVLTGATIAAVAGMAMLAAASNFRFGVYAFCTCAGAIHNVLSG